MNDLKSPDVTPQDAPPVPRPEIDYQKVVSAINYALNLAGRARAIIIHCGDLNQEKIAHEYNGAYFGEVASADEIRNGPWPLQRLEKRMACLVVTGYTNLMDKVGTEAEKTLQARIKRLAEGSVGRTIILSSEMPSTHAFDGQMPWYNLISHDNGITLMDFTPKNHVRITPQILDRHNGWQNGQTHTITSQ